MKILHQAGSELVRQAARLFIIAKRHTLTIVPRLSCIFLIMTRDVFIL